MANQERFWCDYCDRLTQADTRIVIELPNHWHDLVACSEKCAVILRERNKDVVRA